MCKVYIQVFHSLSRISSTYVLNSGILLQLAYIGRFIFGR